MKSKAISGPLPSASECVPGLKEVEEYCYWLQGRVFAGYVENLGDTCNVFRDVRTFLWQVEHVLKDEGSWEDMEYCNNIRELYEQTSDVFMFYIDQQDIHNREPDFPVPEDDPLPDLSDPFKEYARKGRGDDW